MRLIKGIGRLISAIVRFIMKLILIGGLVAVAINLFVIGSTRSQMLKPEQVAQVDRVDEQTPILVLGAGVVNNAEPSKILELRLQEAQAIFQYLPNNPYIMSGDHREDNYNEVQVMKDYLVKQGLPSDQLFLDHAGYSTYDSLYRLKHVIGQKKVIIVTQGYHLPRALMLAKGLGIEAVGVPADETSQTRWSREAREGLARLNDFATIYLGWKDKQPTYKYAIDLTSSGNWTDEKTELPQ